jgi:hypothetical protein
MLVATAKIIPANVGTGPPALFLCPLVEVDFFANYYALSNLLFLDIYGCGSSLLRLELFDVCEW